MHPRVSVHRLGVQQSWRWNKASSAFPCTSVRPNLQNPVPISATGKSCCVHLGTSTDLGEPMGNMTAVLCSKTSLLCKYLHMHTRKESTLLVWFHYPNLYLSPSHLYMHLAFHKSQFPAYPNTDTKCFAEMDTLVT